MEAAPAAQQGLRNGWNQVLFLHSLKETLRNDRSKYHYG